MAHEPKLNNQKKRFDPKAFIRDASHRSAPAPSGAYDTAKMDESLYFIHLIKNGATVKTGEYEALTRIFTGQLMYVDTRDVSVAPHLMMSGRWEEAITKVFQSVLSEGNTVLDLGANFGYFGIIAGAQIGKSGKLLLVEANPELIKYIDKSLAVTGLSRISHVEQVAISEKEGSAEFHFLEDAWGSSGLMDVQAMAQTDHMNYSLRKSFKVRTTAVDSLCAKVGISSADVIKLDIEGYEPHAYEGMRKIIKNSPNLKMFIEFAPDRYKDAEGFFKKLQSDFKCIYHITEPHGELEAIDTYKALDFSQSGWAMLVASKQPL